MRDCYPIEPAIDPQAGRKFGAARDSGYVKVLSPRRRDRADGRTGIDAEERGFAVNLCPDQKMILLGTLQRQGLILRAFQGGLGAFRARAENRSGPQQDH